MGKRIIIRALTGVLPVPLRKGRRLLLIIAATASLLSLSAAPLGALPPEVWDEEGLASWYGGHFQGRTTASGEVFDTHKMTAAHKTLPFGTVVRVTNRRNGLTATVRINDRGPYAEGRIIDLSLAAARKIGLVEEGVSPVRITARMEGNDSQERSYRIIQTGSFSSPKNAEAMIFRLKEAGFSPSAEEAVLLREDGTGREVYRVSLRRIPAASVESVIRQLSYLGIDDVLVKKEM